MSFATAKNNVRDSLAELKRDGTAWLEVIFASFAFASAFWFAWMANDHTHPSFPTFRAFAKFASPESMSGFFIGIGLWQVGAFLLRKRRLRLIAASGCAGVWGGIAAMLLLDSVVGWPAMFCAVIAVFEAIIFIRLCERPRRP